jgi:threonine synthase
MDFDKRMTQYISSWGGNESVDLETAVLQGKATNGGLFVPTELPKVPTSRLESWQALSYQELAFEVLSLFIDRDTVPASDLKRLIKSSFAAFSNPETIPHHQLGDGIVIQELFHGPTLSFKDVAMGFVVNLFDFFLTRRGQRKTLMVATSGDTGPAAAFATIGKPSLDTWLFFPEGLITTEQARQMTTIMAPNVHPVSVTGCRNGSDDLDEVIDACFLDETFRKEMCLSSVNSINWARVMTQTVHYFYGYLRHAKQVGDPVHFSVPCGAFGNMCAGSIAKRMGLPIGKLIVAHNENQTLGTVFETGVFEKNDICNTHATAIDIAVPMNFWRHVYFSLGFDTEQVSSAFEQYETAGAVTFSPKQHAKIVNGFLHHRVSDPDILDTIKSTWEEGSYLLDPHGAVAVAAARRYRESVGAEPIVCLATAHPAKFPNTIELALGIIPKEGQHQSLEDALVACERKYCCDNESATKIIQETMRKVASVR